MKDSVTQEIEKTLKIFNPINLEDMDRVRLMNRVESKFVFRNDQLPYFLTLAKDHYKILEIKGKRTNLYNSLYFDTLQNTLYLNHHNGKADRYKVRYRLYENTNDCFFEIKHKTAKNRTIKNRIRATEIDSSISKIGEKFIMEQSDLDPTSLKPMIQVFYTRITLVNYIENERITFDYNLSYQKNGEIIDIPHLVICEMKQYKSFPSPFSKIMADHHVRRDAISKYCLGVIKLNKSIKYNNFKAKLMYINKLCYD